MIDATSLDRLFEGWRATQRVAVATGSRTRPSFHLANLISAAERQVPIVTVHDASSHAMAWIGSVFGQRVVPVGVDSFGQSGTIADLYGTFGMLPDQLINAALVALDNG